MGPESSCHLPIKESAWWQGTKALSGFGLLLSKKKPWIEIDAETWRVTAIPTVGELMRRAVTLLELLVVLAIIGLLIGLLLPAVQAIRTRALELSNCNNLKQIDLATLHFAETNQGMLPGPFAFQSLDYKAKEPLVLILPYLEQSALYEAFTTNPLALFHAPKSGVGIYFNPLDPTRSATGTQGYGAGINVRSSFAENFCVFNDQPNVTIPDGNSQTIFFAEHHSICGGTEFLFPTYGGASFANRYEGHAHPTMQPLPPSFQHRPTAANCDPRFPNSAGRSGMYCAMGDGSVRLFVPGVRREVFWAAVSPAGAEVMEDL